MRRNWLKRERYPQFVAEVSKADQIKPLARDGRRLAQVALHFALNHPAVTLSRPMSSSTGMVRRPRMTPPMPSVSAMVWRRSYFFGTSKSTTVAGRQPPTWIMQMA